MTRIIMVRHGESKANRDRKFAGCGSDVPLMERGLQQAERMAAYVAEHYAVANVYTSRLQRCGTNTALSCGKHIHVHGFQRGLELALYELVCRFPKLSQLLLLSVQSSLQPAVDLPGPADEKLYLFLIRFAAHRHLPQAVIRSVHTIRS